MRHAADLMAFAINHPGLEVEFSCDGQGFGASAHNRMLSVRYGRSNYRDQRFNEEFPGLASTCVEVVELPTERREPMAYVPVQKAADMLNDLAAGTLPPWFTRDPEPEEDYPDGAMPEYTRVDYLATFEHIHGEDTEYPYDPAADAKFIRTLEERLQPIFPNAEIYVRLDGAQYATYGSQFTPDPIEVNSDGDPGWPEYTCDQVASEVASEVYPDPDPDDDYPDLDDDFPLSVEYDGLWGGSDFQNELTAQQEAEYEALIFRED